MEFTHIPVMLDECITGLNIIENGTYLDCTLGGGGHSSHILAKLKSGLLIGVDKDADAIEVATKKLKAIGDNFVTIRDDYKNIIEHLDGMNIDKLDGVLIDLGVSSWQIDNAERGFSYMQDAHLDMRMDREQELSAYDVVNNYSEAALLKILYEYGEENFARNIVRKIIQTRSKKPIETTGELRAIVESSYPGAVRFKGGHPAKKTFQAIRIEVNEELKGLYEIVAALALRLKVGGRICVISFHSLEDRIIKQCFVHLEKDCICEPSAPICICNKRREILLINKKPIIAGAEELKRNSRSECAKLRIAERV